ncbi:CGA synthase-related protein [Sesbania bispinosa]|nr:CGA synthase-related protein [Sesbania bispinosa]
MMLNKRNELLQRKMDKALWEHKYPRLRWGNVGPTLDECLGPDQGVARDNQVRGQNVGPVQ